MTRQDEIEGAVDVKLFDWQASKGHLAPLIHRLGENTVLAAPRHCQKDIGLCCENQFHHKVPNVQCLVPFSVRNIKVTGLEQMIQVKS